MAKFKGAVLNCQTCKNEFIKISLRLAHLSHVAISIH